MTGEASGLVFVHGINNDAQERAALPEKLDGILKKFGVRDLFTLVQVAAWPSVGDFMADLVNLGSPDGARRQAALGAVVSTLASAVATLQQGMRGRLLVVGHSMGQALARVALAQLAATWPAGKPPIPVSLLTLGGPFGNPVELVRGYLDVWCPPAMRTNEPRQPYLTEWQDVWNPDDPVPSFWHQYHGLPGVPAVKINWPGKPLFHPFSEHGSYFEHPGVFNLVGKMALTLAEAAKRSA